MLSRRHFFATALTPLLRAVPLSNFKLGVTTDEIDEDLLTACRFLREFGLNWAEVRSVWGSYAEKQPLEKVKKMKALLDEHRIRASILSTSFFKVPLPGPEALEAQWKLLDAAMDRAEILDVKKLRTFAFTYKPGETPDPAVFPRIYELVAESARRAGKRGFQLAVENVGGSYVWTGADAAKLLASVKDAALNLNWDPNNAAEKGEHPFPEGYRLLDPARIIHVHLRDFRHNAAGKVEWCAVGEGEADNLGQIRALLKDGFKGTWTLETHWRPPQGKAYASRTSLTALLKVIENA
ncbi:MAG TPA: sugar phosphate isomerase/epimerase family protein [Bryobacteraceae bacterium]|nr:sugar phosphate isomerase/epimerase family protein [Bryobacteraceae bacterium]